MRKIIYILSIGLISIQVLAQEVSQKAAEHYAEAEEYTEKSKQNYIIAAICFAVVIAGNFIRKQMAKNEKEDKNEL